MKPKLSLMLVVVWLAGPAGALAGLADRPP